MKKVFPVVMLIALTGIITNQINAQKLNSYQSKWNPGLVRDYEETLINQMQFDQKSQFMFMISNDEKSLYVDLVVADKAALQKIMRYGLTTWFNPEAKHKKALGIEFPVTSEGSGEPPMMRDKNADRRDMRKAMMDAKNKEMVVIGFEGKNSRRSVNPQDNPDFRGMAEMMEGGKLRISLVVSLDKLQRGNVVSNASPFSLGFETGYMDVTGSGMPSGGGPSSGGGMGGGGGMPGGMPGGGPPPGGSGMPGSMGDSQAQQNQPAIGELASPSKLWIKQVTLAKKP